MAESVRADVIAVIGLEGRFPGADSLEEFWRNLSQGRESISFLSDHELLRSGVAPEELRDPRYVKAMGVLDGTDLFDAEFFAISPREAEVMDPQQRLLLECAWLALENAGCDPSRYPGRVGVFAGMSRNSYLLENLSGQLHRLKSALGLQLWLNNQSDSLTSRISFHLGLRGPSVNVQTACSTSLAAVHLACQSLLDYQCEMALAGGVCAQSPSPRGYQHQENGILSPDGRCRPLDADAQGCLPGEGFGLVVLKRLEDAIEEGDCIRALILGSSLNNDGDAKAGFAAPSVQGQAEAIAEALSSAGISADSISLVELHGTGTPIGDPIEFESLTQAFRETTRRKGFCALSAVKSNIGHLDAAAGIAGLIKTVLALEHQTIPPIATFSRPNPSIDFASSPFFPARRSGPWKRNGSPRRAGINSFGMGGSNVHAVLEEAPPRPGSGPSRNWKLLCLSARTETALSSAATSLADHLQQRFDIDLADAAFTLQVGRKEFERRRFALCRNVDEAVAALRQSAPKAAAIDSRGQPKTVFLFPGQGVQQSGMGEELYRTETTFRRWLDACSRILEPHLGTPLPDLLFANSAPALSRISSTRFAQPALFALEYSLAQLWMEWGIRPHAMLGQSLGEYVAACLSGVFELEEALRLVALRGQLMQSLPKGSMLAAGLEAEELESRFSALGLDSSPWKPGLSIACHNLPRLCVAAGPVEQVEVLRASLQEEGIDCRLLQTSHAFHSPMMEPILESFAREVEKTRRQAPSIPFLSNLSGDWIAPSQALDADYWVRQLRSPVRLSQGLNRILQDSRTALLELGPGHALSRLARNHPSSTAQHAIVSSLAAPGGLQGDQECLHFALGRLWALGVRIDWESYYRGQRRQRLPLPGYPLQRRRFWIEPASNRVAEAAMPDSPQPHARWESWGERLTEGQDHSRLSDGARPPSWKRHGLAEIWSEILGIDDPNPEDDFFDLGGHSLAATQLLSRVREIFGVSPSIEAFFEDPTPAGLARLAREAGGADCSPPLAPAPRGRDAPLSFAQQRLWYLFKTAPYRGFYIVPCAWKLEGELDLPALGASLDRILHRHEALRTRFPQSLDEPVQRVEPAQGLPLPILDLSGLDPRRKDRESRRLLRDETQHPFDIASSPLVRAKLIRMRSEDALEGGEWLLLIATHHIAFDGWSIGILESEILDHYQTFSGEGEAGRGARPLPIQYADFAIWQRERLKGAALEKLLAYWVRQLAEAPNLQMPLDYPRPAAQGFRGAAVSLRIPIRLMRSLENLSHSRNATLFMSLLAGFFTLLHRLTGQTDIVVGSPVANRNRLEVEGLIGFFVNTLALRVDLSRDPSFQEVLDRTRAIVKKGLEFQELPFESLVERLRPRRDPGIHPLFQNAFILHNRTEWSRPRQAGGIALRRFPIELSWVRCDLELHLVPDELGLDGTIAYDACLFRRSSIELLAERYRRLLEAASRSPHLPLSQVPFLGPLERQLLIRDLNATNRAVPGLLAHQLVERWAMRNPHQAAVIGQGEWLSYQQLEGQANRLAEHLRGCGLGPESLAAICLDRSPLLIVAMLAVLKSGAAYLPLDPGDSTERLRFMLQDARPRLLLTAPPYDSRLAGAGTETLIFDGVQAFAPLPEGKTRPAPAVLPQNLAYAIYTSGSTGRPKAVAVAHESLSNLMHWKREAFGLKPGTRCSQISSIGFDASVAEIWCCLGAGATLCQVDDRVRTSPRRLFDWLNKERIDSCFLPTLLAETILQELADSVGWLPPNLWIGGDRLKAGAIERLRGPVHNLYGPAEACVCATWDQIESDRKEPTIGRPISNARVFVLDRASRLAANGAPGQLHLGGAGVARCYLGRPAMTAERFIPDPYSRHPGERIYATGDLTRWNGQHRIEFLGRIDRQLQIRGHRVEPGEVEAVLCRHPKVREASVKPFERGPAGVALAAYVGFRPDASRRCQLEEQRIEQWKALVESTHQRPSSTLSRPESEFVGWRSSYTGEPFSLDEMDDWAEAAAAGIRARNPRSILEIGCGSGALLDRLAPNCSSYVGCDFSQSALKRLAERISALDASKVELVRTAADDLRPIGDRRFDAVVLNSVAQYFPSADYLARVLQKCFDALKPEGFVFLGDIRIAELQRAYCLSLQLHRARDAMPLAELAETVRLQAFEERELLVSPLYFQQLKKRFPQIQRVTTLPKRSRYRNEMSRFRGDVIVSAGPGDGEGIRPDWIDWRQAGLDLGSLRRQLEEGSADLLAFRGLPNSRLDFERNALRLLESDASLKTAGDLKRAAARGPSGIDPEELRSWQRCLPYQVDLGWPQPGSEGRFDVVFRKRAGDDLDEIIWDDAAGAPQGRALFNDPLQGARTALLVPQLRSWASRRLPRYMQPSSWVVMDGLPKSSSGKIDRASLPQPLTVPGSQSPLNTALERGLARIWQQLLGVEKIGADDDFFELGGHSLLATQAISRIRRRYGYDLALSRFLLSPTIRGLAEQIERLAASAHSKSSEKIMPCGLKDALPLSFAQERLWFLDRLSPANPFYNISTLWKLSGQLRPSILEACFRAVLNRHEALRTTFPEAGGVPTQKIGTSCGWNLPIVDLTGLPTATREAHARRLTQKESHRPFDLARDWMLRCLAIRMEGDDPEQGEWLLTLVMHHIAADGWSLGILIQELTELHQEVISRKSLESPIIWTGLPKLPVQYADFALWQRSWLQGDRLQELLDYWSANLKGASTLEVPTDRSRPAVQSFRGRTISLQLTQGLSQALKDLSKDCGATLFMTLLSAFQVLLHRYSGQTDVVIGSPIAARRLVETEPLIGLFVNTLALRGDLSGDPPFLDLLKRTRRCAIDAFTHQDLPFEKLVERLKPARDLSRNPVCQALFALQNVSFEELSLADVRAHPLALEAHSTYFDVELHLRESEHGLIGCLSYDRDLFDPPRMQRLIEHFRVLLDGIAADPRARLSRLPLMTSGERLQLQELDGDRRSYSCHLLHRFVEIQAAGRPDADALLFEGASVTYSQLDDQAEGVARRLRRLQAGPEVVIGICLERSPGMVAALVGTLKSGAIALPLDPDYPQERIEFMLRDSRAAALITDRGLSQRLDLERVPTLHLDECRSDRPPSHCGSRRDLAPSNGACLIYTSGSSGSPKGVLVPHRAICNHVSWISQALPLNPASRVLQRTSLSFDAAWGEIFGALAQGAALILTDSAQHRNAKRLVECIQRHRAAVIDVVPALLEELLEEGLASCPSLSRIYCGGDVLAPSLRDRVLSCLPEVELYNFYGPTEAAIDVTWGRCRGTDPAQSVPIGKPKANVAIRLLDAHLNQVPKGVPGEICIAGAALARGYFARPGLTAQRFLPDPSSPKPGGRMYRSGDVGVQLENGDLKFIGRRDLQAQIRGIRIELGEIEESLKAHPQVVQAAAEARPDRSGRLRLIAFYSTAAERPEAGALREFLRRRLPAFMLPSKLIGLDSLPLTPQGKIDRRALSKVDDAVSIAPPSSEMPRSRAEKLVAGLWRSLLEIDHVGIHDSFFDLGGHSLLLVRARRELCRLFRRDDIALADLFAYPTVSSLAAHLSRPNGNRGGERRDAAMTALRRRLARRADSKRLRRSRKKDFRRPIEQG